MKLNKRSYTKIALTLSVILLLVWVLLGTGTSIAWFKDTTPIEKNAFFVGELDLEVYRLTEADEYERVTAETSVFDDSALYEPGYVQVVRLKVRNEGTVPFDWKLAVGVNDYLPATNMFGQTFNLQDHIKFGIVTAESESELETKIASRTAAESIAQFDMPLNTYSTEKELLDAGNETFVAIIVRMPDDVDNIANHNGRSDPYVELGLIVKATQIGTPE